MWSLHCLTQDKNTEFAEKQNLLKILNLVRNRTFWKYRTWWETEPPENTELGEKQNLLKIPNLVRNRTFWKYRTWWETEPFENTKLGEKQNLLKILNLVRSKTFWKYWTLWETEPSENTEVGGKQNLLKILNLVRNRTFWEYWTWWETEPSQPRSTTRVFYGSGAQLGHLRSLDSSVGIVTRLRASRPRYPISIPGSGKKWSSTPRRPDRRWDPPYPLFNWHHGLFPRGVKRLRGMQPSHHHPYVFMAWAGTAVPLPLPLPLLRIETGRFLKLTQK